jgi:replicative superfamily II helicase
MAYVEISEEDVKSIFKEMKVDAFIQDIPRCYELVWNISTKNPKIQVRIYSSIDHVTRKSRSVGEDAIRLVFWSVPGKHPIGKGRRIYRVTSTQSIKERISKQIEDFMSKASTVQLTDWDYVRAVLNAGKNGKSGFVDSLIESLEKYKRLTDGQLSYVLGKENPKGFDTIEEKLKKGGWEYSPILEDEKSTPALTPTPTEKAPRIVEKQAPGGINEAIKVLSDVPNMTLMTTANYPCYKFTHFNPIQTITFPFKGEDVNLVIGANTSAGKTVCAELLMDETLKQGKRVIYLSPLKSLTQEKYEDWKERFRGFNISILTGDYVLSKEKSEELQGSRIIVMTSEMTDSRTRRMEAERNYWLKEVGLVVVDETHILTTDRGHAVESGIMRFTSINREARILFLSATMPNVDQLGVWLKSLNGKETKVIFSTWRPVELQYHYVEYPVPISRWGGADYKQTQFLKKKAAIDIVTSKSEEKFLIFCHDKNTGHSIVGMLKEEGIESQFHNADLDLKERLETESSFEQRQGGLRVLVSTSTLAWGRNLPARNVIVVGIHRGLEEVDELDIIQMAGRAGRYGIDPEGHVFLIIPSGSTESWKEIFKNPRPVTSILNNHHVLAFHVLAEIQNRVVIDPTSLLRWYSRSLAYMQEKKFSLEDAKALLDDLEKMEMVINQGNYYTLTGLGKTSGWLYYSPYDVYAWYKNFNAIFKPIDGKTIPMDDLTLAWAVTDIPNNNWGYIPKDVASECEELRWQLKNRGVQASDSIHFSLAALKCLQGIEVNNGSLKANCRSVKYDIRRVVQALSTMDGVYAKWEKKSLWKVLGARVTYGIPEEMVELTRLSGIGGVKARKMWEMGIHTLQDVTEHTDLLKRMFIPTMIHKIRKEAKVLLNLDKEKEDTK